MLWSTLLRTFMLLEAIQHVCMSTHRVGAIKQVRQLFRLGSKAPRQSQSKLTP